MNRDIEERPSRDGGSLRDIDWVSFWEVVRNATEALTAEVGGPTVRYGQPHKQLPTLTICESRSTSRVNTGCIEGFFKAENCKENVVESINTISLFCVPKSVIKFRPSPRS